MQAKTQWKSVPLTGTFTPTTHNKFSVSNRWLSGATIQRYNVTTLQRSLQSFNGVVP